MLADLVDPYLRERTRRHEITPLTARNHRTTLYQFAAVVGARPLRQVGRRDVQRWLESCENLAAATRRSRFSMVRTFGSWLVEQGHVRRNPTAGIRTPRKPRGVPRALSLDAVQAMLSMAPDQRARLIAILGVQQGLRIGEIAGLEFGDVDWRGMTMRITGKGRHVRLLPITDECAVELQRYVMQHPASSGPLVRSYQYPTRALVPTTIGNILRRMLYESGVKSAPLDGVSAHSLRHTAASDMLLHGAHLRDVQAALGHAHLSTTEVYLPLVVHGLAEAMEGRRYTVP